MSLFMLRKDINYSKKTLSHKVVMSQFKEEGRDGESSSHILIITLEERGLGSDVTLGFLFGH